MNDKAEHYLDYLDKEMGIMGVLSTFSLAVPSLFFERIISADPQSMAHVFLETLWNDGAAYLIAASVLMLLGAASFYKQRSLLAWYYGQIALEMAIPDYTAKKLGQWLKEADSWQTWFPYSSAIYMSFFAALQFILAIFSVYNCTIYRCALPGALILSALLAVWLLWVWRNSKRFKFDEEAPYYRFRK